MQFDGGSRFNNIQWKLLQTYPNNVIYTSILQYHDVTVAIA